MNTTIRHLLPPLHAHPPPLCLRCSGTFGPFKPHRPAVVPLWLALDLKRRNLCDVYPPDWLTTAQLQVPHPS